MKYHVSKPLLVKLVCEKSHRTRPRAISQKVCVRRHFFLATYMKKIVCTYDTNAKTIVEYIFLYQNLIFEAVARNYSLLIPLTGNTKSLFSLFDP